VVGESRFMNDVRRSIGQLLFVGIPSVRLDDTTRQILNDLHPGGVILFRRNVGTFGELRELTAELHALPSRPLVAIDHEGGRVMRLGEPFTQFPPAAAIGRTRDADVAYRVGRAMAQELASVSIDVSFAPVLDVHSNPANPVIGDRAFGSDPELVSALGVAMMRGLRDGGVIPCGKHFPGHGDTEKDSHIELPVVRRSREQLAGTELVPFRAAIAAGMPMLMTAHVVYPSLDGDRPATLSQAILAGLLRNELRFDGVIASDDLAMRAIVDHHGIGDAAVATLRAGVDALLVCQELTHAVRAREAIAAAISGGTLQPQIVEAAVKRLQPLRELRTTSAVSCTLPNAAHRALVDDLRRS